MTNKQVNSLTSHKEYNKKLETFKIQQFGLVNIIIY